MSMKSQQSVVTLLQASQRNPALAKLMDLQRESSARLKAITHLIPAPLRASIQAGPIEDGAWCLILNGNTVAAKVRQLLPMFETHLKTNDLEVTSIRLKIQKKQ